jgi:cyclase
MHSYDSTVLLLPDDRILLAGDTVEDTITFIAEPADLPIHLQNLAVLRGLAWDRLLPNHGNPAVIATGGYDRGIVDATSGYIATLLHRASTPGFLNMPLEAFAARYWAHGWTSLWEPYREAHAWNLGQVSSVWGR